MPAPLSNLISAMEAPVSSFRSGSIRDSVPSTLLATHTALGVTAIELRLGARDALANLGNRAAQDRSSNRCADHASSSILRFERRYP